MKRYSVAILAASFLLASSVVVYAKSENARVGSESEQETEDSPGNSDNAEKFKMRVMSDDGVQIKTQQKDEENTKTQIRTSDGGKIKIRTKDGNSTVDVFSKGNKVRFEFDGGEFTAKTDDGNASGSGEMLDENDALTEVENDLESEGIGVATSSGDIVLLHRGRSATSTKFPLSVDLSTNELIVTTPAGEKRVTVLPDQAIANLIKTRVFDQVDDQQDPQVDPQVATDNNINSVYQLQDQNGELKYTITGKSHQSILGIFPVDIQKTVEVSAETGQVIAQHQSLLQQILDFFAD